MPFGLVHHIKGIVLFKVLLGAFMFLKISLAISHHSVFLNLLTSPPTTRTFDLTTISHPECYSIMIQNPSTPSFLGHASTTLSNILRPPYTLKPSHHLFEASPQPHFLSSLCLISLPEHKANYDSFLSLNRVGYII